MKSKIKTILQFLLFEALFFLHLPAQLVGQISPAPAQNSRWQEAGLPFIQNFSPKEYNAHNQNWAIVQDQRGIMYFGNESGVLEYDGVSWRLIPVTNRSVVRSLAVDSAGRIYVGAQREFGYLSADSIGQLRYVSLLEHLDEEDRDFADVWEIFPTSKGIYFRTSGKILCWLDKQFKVWNPDSRFHTSFIVRDTLYVRQWRVGLMRIEGDSLHLLPGGEQFANERTYVMLPYDARRILVGTRTKGLFLYDGSSFLPFKTEPAVSRFFQKHNLYHGANLPDGTLALAASLSGGVAIIDRQGRLLRILNNSAGIRHEGVNFIYQTDREMWLALDNGLAKVEIASPLTIFKDSIEKNGIIYSILRHQGDIYLATGSGIQYFDTRQNAFRIIPGTNTQCWQLLSANALRFEYAVPFYEGLAENRFQYFLQGFDQDWSDWTRETWKDYTNLREGRYSFRVRAKNIYGQFSREDVFEFTILPPWYRAWWAYAFYTVCFGLALYGVRRVEMKRVQGKYKRELEQVEYGKLKDLDQMKSQFFANISHEFRTPLTLILGPAEDLISEATGARARQKATLVQRNAQRLLRLINQLLDLAKLETGKTQLQAGPGDFVKFFKGLVMSFESWAERKQIKLAFELHHSSGLPAIAYSTRQAYFDPDVVEKIFTNLMSNALKFTPTQGSMNVTCTLINDCRLMTVSSDTGQYVFRSPKCEICTNNLSCGQGANVAVNCVEITVKDSGVGIAADRLPHIFDRFYQADSSSTRGHEGTGIGLALVKELVELHNGTIAVQSREGHGTIFTVCLPLGKNHLQVDEIVESKGGANGGSRLQVAELKPATESIEETGGSEPLPPVNPPLPEGEQNEGINDTIVLIIEDNADMRAYIREHLEPVYKILEAKDGAEGIDKAIETIPDLVISDVMMPKKNGYQVCQTLKTEERTSHIPVILLTAKAAEDERIAGLETGADAYVLKPFRPKELLVRVRKLIELRRNLRQRFSAATVIKPSEIAGTSMDQEFLQRVITTIEALIRDNEFDVEALAKKVAMSASQINRKLNALTGQPASQLIRGMRLQRAADLLAQNSGTVAEIAYQVGFSDQAHFSRSFRKQFGCPPSKFKKN